MEEQYYKVNGQLRVEMDVYLTDEVGGPSISECRYAVLSLASGHVIYDRLLNRIVNGIFYTTAEDIIQVARNYNRGNGTPDMSPNGYALKLTYPTDYLEVEES